MSKYKIINKKTCTIDKTVKIEDGCIIYPNNTILGNTILRKGCILYPGNVIIDSIIMQKSIIKCSFIEKSIVNFECTIGPFANLREKNIVGNRCRIGNFCELKNCTIGDDTKVSHMSYLGDVDIGKKCNIGAGVIVANYDGKTKHHSTIGDNVFVGCNCNIISPIKIANNTFLCAGTTLTKSTNNGDFVIGRARESIKPSKSSI